jgi:RNA polymerase sigma factor (TIGR02999 family)
MDRVDAGEITALLREVQGTAGRPLDALFARVYDELRGLAHRVRDGRAGETLNTTALVHEAYLKLFPSRKLEWQSRAHFFAVAARAMRQVLVDAARHRQAQKRGGDVRLVTLGDGEHAAPLPLEELIALEDALTRLAALDDRRVRVVELRFFTGLTVPEIAEVLGVSVPTVEREWRSARAWLTREMRAGEET